MLIDSHAHLTDEKFNENRFDIISSLSKNNVEKDIKKQTRLVVKLGTVLYISTSLKYFT